MVIRERQRLTVVEAVKIITESKDTQEALEKLHALKPRRQPAPPPPEGGIGIRQAARKYGVPASTLSDWANAGKIKSISRTKNWFYLDEEDLAAFLRAKRSAEN